MSDQSNVCPTHNNCSFIDGIHVPEVVSAHFGTGRKSEPFDHWVGEDGSTNLEYKSKSEPTGFDGIEIWESKTLGETHPDGNRASRRNKGTQSEPKENK